MARDAVVFLDRGAQTIHVDLHDLGEVFKRFGLLHAALFEHVVHRAAAQKVDLVFVRIAQMVLHEPEGLAGLREDGLAQDVARGAQRFVRVGRKKSARRSSDSGGVRSDPTTKSTQETAIPTVTTCAPKG